MVVLLTAQLQHHHHPTHPHTLPHHFAGTVAENIGFGSGMRCSQQDIERAARAANAHDFIAALPEGYATVVGERGSLLSGGWTGGSLWFLPA